VRASLRGRASGISPAWVVLPETPRFAARSPTHLTSPTDRLLSWLVPRLGVAATLLTYTVAAPSSKTTNVTSTLPPPPNTPPRITTNQFDTLWQRTRDTHFARLKAR